MGSYLRKFNTLNLCIICQKYRVWPNTHAIIPSNNCDHRCFQPQMEKIIKYYLKPIRLCDVMSDNLKRINMMWFLFYLIEQIRMDDTNNSYSGISNIHHNKMDDLDNEIIINNMDGNHIGR